MKTSLLHLFQNVVIDEEFNEELFVFARHPDNLNLARTLIEGKTIEEIFDIIEGSPLHWKITFGCAVKVIHGSIKVLKDANQTRFDKFTEDIFQYML
jgi:hypothetical protein